jgi:voltage-gated potassium channel
MALVASVFHAPTIQPMHPGYSVRRFVWALTALAVVLVAGTLSFHAQLNEGWLAAFYRAVVTTSLTGLDSTPHGRGAEAMTIVLVLAGVAIFAFIAAVIVEALARDVLTGAWSAKRRRRTIDALKDHYIVCGYGRVGRRVAEELRAASIPYVVLDFNEQAIAAARENDELYIDGNATEDDDLQSAGVTVARGLVAASDSDTDNLYICLSARAACPGILIVARASDEEAEKKLKLAGADRVVLPYAIAGRVMANLVAKPQVAAFLNVVSTASGEDLQFEEIEVTAACGQSGRTIGELRVAELTGAYIVAVRKTDGQFDTRPGPRTLLETGDVLVGVGSSAEIEALEELFAPREAVAS